MLVSGIEAHQDVVKRESANALAQRVRTMMSRDAEKSHHFLVSRLQQSFHGSAFREDLIYIRLGADVMELPYVDVVGLQQSKRFLDHAHRSIARPFFRLRGHERFVAASLQGLTDIAF